jgi:anti-sigma factor RsiW
MGPVGHLGTRVSALLDGQLSPEDTERAWAHVHACHACRDLVEREGWVKTSLAGLSLGPRSTPDSLKGSLLGALPTAPCGDAFLVDDRDHRRRQIGLVALGGGAVGAAVMGVLALGIAPADAPVNDRRTPPATITHTQSPRIPAPTEPTLARSSAARQH